MILSRFLNRPVLAIAIVSLVTFGSILTGSFAVQPAATIKADTPPAAAVKGDTPPIDAEEQAAVRATLDDFCKAIESGDAKACAAFWTTGGEQIGEDGVTVKGRAAIEKSYAEMFARHPKPKVQLERKPLRFLSKDAAVEEGYFTVRLDAKGSAAASRYSALFAREDGRWRLALLREWPNEGVNIRDLDWLVGEWTSGREGVSVRTVYEWDLNKTVIRGRYTVTRTDSVTSGLQLLAKDPASGKLTCWTFDDSGGLGTAVWTNDGKQWTIASEGTDADGASQTATNVLVQLNDNTYTWQSTGRTSDGEALPDLPPVKVSRQKLGK